MKAWISVKDRLPDKSQNVLIYHNGNMTICHYSAKHKLFGAHDSSDRGFAKAISIKPTHWLPLPEAPKMKGGAEQ